jgi:4-amino-4-deoxy-L-arabinose transferase-like glycosyltransferase
MEYQHKKMQERFQWTIWAIVFLVFFFSELVEYSMYIDGVWYAVIAQNLSVGKGTFWLPQFSETIFQNFHEHPPLVFWLQSHFFKLLGNHWFTERVFCFVQYMVTALLISYLWTKMFKDRPRIQQWWIMPLLLWQVNLASYYFLPANLLENSLVIFDLLSIILLWKVIEHNHVFFHLLGAAFCLILCFLSKGLVGLFPIGFLGLYWLIFRSNSIFRIIFQTSLLIMFSLCILGLLFWWQPLAFESLSNYWDIQVLASLKGERRLYFFRDSRFYILGQLALVLLPMIIMVILNIGMIRFWKKMDLHIGSFFKSKEGKLIQVFFLIGLSASLPLIVSPRQALPYLLPSIPFFSLAFGGFAAHLLDDWWQIFMIKRGRFIPVLNKVLGFLVIGVLVLCLTKLKTPNNRDSDIINDVEKIGSVIGKNQVISSNHYDMYISGYLMRHNNISLDTLNHQHLYFITPKNQPLKLNNYEQIDIKTQIFDLYKKGN